MNRSLQLVPVLALVALGCAAPAVAQDVGHKSEPDAATVEKRPPWGGSSRAA